MAMKRLRESRKIAAFVLAAGCSKRFHGKLKQLLPFREKPMLQRVVDEACMSVADEVFLVLGCKWRTISRHVKAERASIVINRNYEEGLSSSLRIAIRKARQINADACVILLGDQPLINHRFIDKIIDIFLNESDASGILSRYGKVVGTPAIIGKVLFDEVEELRGDAGAKALLAKRKDVIKVDAPAEMLRDVDTEEDYRNLMKTL